MKTPYAYQRTVINAGVETSVYNGDVCGLGKTLSAIETVKALRATGDEQYQRPVLVLTPKKVGPQWIDELRSQDVDEPIYLLGKAGAGLPEEVEGKCWVIMHYEALQYISEQLLPVAWSVIIADEAHRIKNRKAVRTRLAKLLRAARKIALSGTPMEKNPADLWSVLQWLYPVQYPSYWRFFNQYVEVKENYLGYKVVVGGKNLDQLAEEIGSFFFRRTKEEVAPQLPPKIMQRVTVDMDEQQTTVYTKLRKSHDIEVDLGQAEPMLIKNALAKIVRLQQLSSDPKLLDFDISSAKIEWLLDYVDDNPEEVIVVFTKFRDTAIRLSQQLKADLIIGGQKVGGGVKFMNGSTNILVGTIAAMGEGLNLQRAGTAIFLDQEWSSVKMTQAIDRIHRIDDVRPKSIIYLTTKGTVDKLVLEALDQKWSDLELAYRYIREYS